MKTKIFTLSLFSAMLLFVSSCSTNADLAVKVTDSDTDYKFTAEYDRDKTIEVQQYINAALKPNRIFSDHEERVVKDVKLTDGSTFHMKSSPGDLVIEFDKTENDQAAYENMKSVCLAVKEIVAGK